MPSHSGIGSSRTTAPLPPRPPLLLPPLLPPPLRAPNGRASLVRAPRARRAGTCGGAGAGAAATRAGGPSRSEAVRSGDGRGEASPSRGSSKGTGLIPNACPGLNQLGRCGGEKHRAGGVNLPEGRGGAAGAPSAGESMFGQDKEGLCE